MTKYVSIYCAEESHAEAPWLIASFLPRWESSVGESGALIWQESTGYWRDNRVIKELRGLRGSQDGTSGGLSGDRYVSHAEFEKDPSIFENGDSRARYRFECQTCGLTLERRGPAVEATFQKLVDAGESEISLRGLIFAIERTPD